MSQHTKLDPNFEEAPERHGCFFTLLGAAIVVAVSIWSFRISAFLARAETTQGVVVKIEESGAGSDAMYAPVVRFQLSDGARHVSTLRAESGNSLKVGDVVAIHYDPDDPDFARAKGVLRMWLLPLGFALIGLSLLVVGVFGLRGAPWAVRCVKHLNKEECSDGGR